MKIYVQQVFVFFGLMLVACSVCAQQEEVRAKAETGKQAQVEAREKPLRDADALIKKGKPAEAYTLLESLKLERFGEVRVNYLLGIAALESGKPDRAALAFERVLVVDKNYPGVRLDMARAYFRMGDLPRARTEFQAVMAQNPPEGVKFAVQTLLDAINEQEGATAGNIEGTLGRDSKAGPEKKSKVVAKSVNQDDARAIQAQREAEAQTIAKQQARQHAEARAIAEQEARQRAEAEAKKQAEVEARAMAEQEARQRAEAEIKKQAEVKARAIAEREVRERAEAEAKKQAEIEARAKAEQEARERAEAEAKKQAAAQTLKSYIEMGIAALLAALGGLGK